MTPNKKKQAISSGYVLGLRWEGATWGVGEEGGWEESGREWEYVELVGRSKEFL